MIEVTNLRKEFGPKVAVNDVSFSVKKGEVLGFLGPNGAGKSTTMRMITGFFPPTSGKVTIGGACIINQPALAKSRFGYLPESAPLYNEMTVEGFLKYAADLRGLSGSKRSKAVDHAVDLCFLKPVKHQVIDTLSKGYRHRTCLAQSLLHDPDVLILDEPTDGLDPNQKQEVRQLLKRLGENKTIIFSTHILEEVDAACTRAIIIDQGKIVADGTPQQLRNKAKNAGAIEVEFTGDNLGNLSSALKLSHVESVEVLTASDHIIHARLHPTNVHKGNDIMGELNQMARERNLSIHKLALVEGRLDDLFRTLTTADTAKLKK